MRSSRRSNPDEVHRILLVDDNPHGLVARRRLLEESGYQVATALSGELALDLCAAERFDVVVTDLKMGGIDGLQVIKSLRSTAPSIRLVLLSGFVEPLGLTPENTGADAVIPKCALEVNQLLRALEALLSPRARRKPARSETAPRTSVAKSV